MTLDAKARRLLADLADRYETESFLEGDPSCFMHRVSGDANREATAFVAASLSFGARSQFLPKVAAFLKKPLQWLSIVIFVAMVVLSFSSNIDAFLVSVKYIFLVVLIHNLLALTLGFSVATVAKLPYRDRRTLTIETGIQNSGLGLALMLGTSLFANFPPHGGMLVITAWWGIWHIISGLTVATIFNKTRKDA